MVLDGAGVEVGVLPRHQDVNGVTSKMETRITFPYPFVGRAILTKTI